MYNFNISELEEGIKKIRKQTEDIKSFGENIPTVIKTCDNILSLIKILELNIFDTTPFE